MNLLMSPGVATFYWNESLSVSRPYAKSVPHDSSSSSSSSSPPLGWFFSLSNFRTTNSKLQNISSPIFQRSLKSLNLRRSEKEKALLLSYRCRINDSDKLKDFSCTRFQDRIKLLNEIRSCGKGNNIWRVKRIHADIVKKDLIKYTPDIAAALISKYAKCGALDKAQDVFERLLTRDVTCWNALMTGYIQHGLSDKALKCFKNMKEARVRPDRVTYIFVLKACGIGQSLKVGEEIDAEIRKQGLLHKDVMLGNTLVGMYCKCGALLKAQEVFEHLPNRNVVTWNSLISGYVQSGLGCEGLKCFRQMQDARVCPNAVTYICALKACGIVGSLQVGEYIDAEVRKKGLLYKDIVLSNTLMDMYSKCDALEKARELFEQLPVHDVVSWNIMITGCARHGLDGEVIKCFRQMEDEGVNPDAITYACILKSCGIVGSLEVGEDINTKIRKQGLLQKNVVLNTALVDMYSKFGALEKAQEVCEKLLVQDVIPWNALLTGYCQHGLGQEALNCFRSMRNKGIRPDVVTYVCVLKASSIVKSIEVGEDIDTQVRKQGLLQKNIVLGTALVDMYFKCGKLDKAREVFEQLPVRDVVSWNAMIAGYAQNGLGEEALRCFRQMQNEGVYPDVTSYICSLKACSILGSLEFGQDIDAEVRKQGLLQKSIVLGTALVDMYSKCGALEKAEAVFQMLPKQDPVSWNALLTGYTQHGFGEEALKFFRQMQDLGICPTAVTYICILKACGIVGSLELGKDIDIQIRKQGLLQKDTELGTTLVGMYSKCGAPKKAREAFEELPAGDIMAWNSLIDGYAQLGQANMVLDMYMRMRSEGAEPNLITFTHFLSACSHAGLLKEGEKLFNEMRAVYCLKPTLEHYTCMIDLFGRAGHLGKATSFLDEVSHSGYLPLFIAMLGACRKSENMQLGRWVFEKSVQLDENCGRTYVCMENMYAAAG